MDTYIPLYVGDGLFGGGLFGSFVVGCLLDRFGVFTPDSFALLNRNS